MGDVSVSTSFEQDGCDIKWILQVIFFRNSHYAVVTIINTIINPNTINTIETYKTTKR